MKPMPLNLTLMKGWILNQFSGGCAGEYGIEDSRLHPDDNKTMMLTRDMHRLIGNSFIPGQYRLIESGPTAVIKIGSDKR